MAKLTNINKNGVILFDTGDTLTIPNYGSKVIVESIAGAYKITFVHYLNPGPFRHGGYLRVGQTTQQVYDFLAVHNNPIKENGNEKPKDSSSKG